jgi:hypothetical protein
MRLQLILLNTVFLVLFAKYLANRFSSFAAAGALLLLVCNAYFYIWASSIRVDMLTAVVGLLALVFLLSGRFFWSGVVCAISFFVSQKGAYYIISQFLACGLLLFHFPKKEIIKQKLIPMILGMGLPTLIYAAVWSPCFSAEYLFRTVFVKHADKAFGDLYRESLNFLSFWDLALQTNWFYYLLFVAGLLHLFFDRDKNRIREEVLLFGYSATLMILSIRHTQPWPYFFVIFLPTTTLVIARFLDFSLKAITGMRRHTQALFCAVFVIYASYPLNYFQFIEDIPYLDVQKKVIKFLEQDLREDENYIGPTSYLYTKMQPIALLSSLDSPRIFRINALSEVELDGYIEQIKKSRVKYFLLNARSKGLPKRLKDFIHRNYKQLWHMVYSYAPTVTSSETVLFVEFAGKYRILSKQPVVINEATYNNQDTLILPRGQVDVSGDFRLQLLPNQHQRLLPGSPLEDDTFLDRR